MRFEADACPECGASPEYIVETMLLHYSIELGDDGHFEYSGHSQEFIETAEPVLDGEGRVTLGCAQGHEWQSATPSPPP